MKKQVNKKSSIERINKAKNLMMNEIKNHLFEKEYQINELTSLINRLNIKGEQARELVVFIFMYQHYLNKCAANGCNFNEEPNNLFEIEKRLVMMNNVQYDY